MKTRLEKGLTQTEMGELLFMDQSQYSRRENGGKKISDQEWEKMAAILDVDMEDIYQEEDKSITINNENGSSGSRSYQNINNNYYVSSEDNVKLIQQLKQQETIIAQLKEEIEKLKGK